MVSTISNQWKYQLYTPHSSTLAWKIPWTEEPGRLQSMGSLRVGHDWVTSLSLLTFMHWRRKWQPTPVFLPGESQGRGSLVGAVISGVQQSQTRQKRLSSKVHLIVEFGVLYPSFWKRERLPTPVFQSRQFYGLYSPMGSQRARYDRVTFTHPSFNSKI